MKKYLISILSILLLFTSCDSTLDPPAFEVYLCPVSDVDVNLKNTSTLNIQWSYPDSSIEDICDQDSDSFIIYYIVEDNPLPSIPSTEVEPKIVSLSHSDSIYMAIISRLLSLSSTMRIFPSFIKAHPLDAVYALTLQLLIRSWLLLRKTK